MFQRSVRLVLGAYYAFVIAFPVLVFAQAGLPRQIVPCDGVNCTFCDLATLAQNIINTAVFVFVLLSAGLFTYAGILMATSAEKPGNRETGRKLFTNVALGLGILLSAWLIVDTLMKSVLGGSFGPWNNICQFLS